MHKNNQAMSDRYFIWRNPPMPAIVELADRTGMSETGRRIFFASAPSIDDAADFNTNCSDIETTMIILGCYANGRIHIFNISYQPIAAAKYVTSAHEMLHAAYVRLSKGQREIVDGMLEDAYQYASANDELRDLMDEYARMEPDQRYNELHSILGTEYAGLPTELEKYYARYFTDQRKIVEMAGQYRMAFKMLETEQTALKLKLDRLTVEIDADASLYDTMIQWLNNDIEDFNNKEFYSRSEFNAERDALIEKEKELKKFSAKIKASISQHNKLVREYNNLGGKIIQLNYQIDSKLQQEFALETLINQHFSIR